jgi:hypothetical protein
VGVHVACNYPFLFFLKKKSKLWSFLSHKCELSCLVISPSFFEMWWSISQPSFHFGPGRNERFCWLTVTKQPSAFGNGFVLYYGLYWQSTFGSSTGRAWDYNRASVISQGCWFDSSPKDIFFSPPKWITVNSPWHKLITWLMRCQVDSTEGRRWRGARW